LFQIYHGICVPISIQIKKDMIKLLQKQNGAVFYASQCIFKKPSSHLMVTGHACTS